MQTIDYTKYSPTSKLTTSEDVCVVLGRIHRNYKKEYTVSDSRISSMDVGQYSKSCRYHKIEHVVYIHACYRMTKDKLHLSYDRACISGELVRQAYSLTAISGFKWQLDEFGFCLCSVQDCDINYHPSLDDLYTAQYHPCMVRDWAYLAVDNARHRKEIARQKELDQASYDYLTPLVKVTLYDSIRSGNCMQGTLQFAQSNGIKYSGERDIYSGIRGDLLKRFNGRAIGAIYKAIERQSFVLGAGI